MCNILSHSLGARMKAPVMLAAPNSYQERNAGNSVLKHLLSSAMAL